MGVLKPMIAFSAVALSIAPTIAQAQEAPHVTVTVDERGIGSVVIGTTVRGIPSAPLTNGLAYFLGASNLVPGDVILTENGNAGSDLIRFLTFSENPGFRIVPVDTALSGMVFFSDNADGADDPADIHELAQRESDTLVFAENHVTLPEVGTEGDNGAFYTPGPNDPGYVPDYAVTYHFISDRAVPEPTTWAMMLLGLGGIGFAMRRKRAGGSAQAA